MKKASKVDYFAILHPLVLIILPAMAYLIWHMLKTILFTFLNLLIGKPIVKQDDSFLIVFFLYMYRCFYPLFRRLFSTTDAPYLQ